MLQGQSHHLLLFDGQRPDQSRLAATQEEIAALTDRYAAPITLDRVPSEQQELHQRYGADTATLFLVRPDGHVAYRGAAEDITDLKLYLDRLFVRRASASIQS